jgi:hypothetical protein
MKQIVIEVPESKYEFFGALMSELGFAKKDINDEGLVYTSVKRGLKEVNLIRSGKLPKRPIQKLLREI